MQIADAVDIVVLNCDNNGYIQRFIESVRNNTEGPYKIIVVDQNSKDGSREWLVNESGLGHIILNKKNVGCAEGRNQGVRAGNNEWIAMFDSDIEIKDKDWLDKMWNYTIDRKIGFVEGKVTLYSWDSGQDMFAGMAFNLIRRRCFNEIGYFDKNFIIGEDLDWYVRLEHSGWKTAYCPDTNVCHFRHATMKNSFGDKLQSYIDDRNKRLKYKYTKEFLKDTLEKHSERRWQKQRELLGKENEVR
jgi:O-antigen biosynthesis protein